MALANILLSYQILNDSVWLFYPLNNQKSFFLLLSFNGKLEKYLSLSAGDSNF